MKTIVRTFTPEQALALTLPGDMTITLEVPDV